MGKIKDFFAGLELSILIAEAVEKAEAEYDALEKRYSAMMRTQPLVDPEAETIPIGKIEELEIEMLGAIYDRGNKLFFEELVVALKKDRLLVEYTLNQLIKKIWVDFDHSNIGEDFGTVYHISVMGIEVLKESRYGK